jgi:hypothetical protein
MGERLEAKHEKLRKLVLWVAGTALFFAYLVVSKYAS